MLGIMPEARSIAVGCRWHDSMGIFHLVASRRVQYAPGAATANGVAGPCPRTGDDTVPLSK